jgi:hypothetical protein
MPYQKVTYLEELPDIDEVDGGDSNSRPNTNMTQQQAQMSKRFIRHAPSMFPESGMVLNPSESVSYNNNSEENMNNPGTIQNNIFRNSPIIEMPNNMSQQMQMQMQPPVMTCQDIFYHIESCPLCTKFYKHDNTMYLITIAILVLVCALLLKKVLFE